MIKKSDIEEVKVHRYPFEDDNDQLEEEILNPTASIPDSYLRDSENCQITRWHTIPQKTKISEKILRYGSIKLTLTVLASPIIFLIIKAVL